MKNKILNILNKDLERHKKALATLRNNIMCEEDIYICETIDSLITYIEDLKLIIESEDEE